MAWRRILLAVEHAPRSVAHQTVGRRAVLELESPHGLEHVLVEQLLVGAGFCRDVEPLPEEDDLLVLDAELEHGAVGDDDHIGLGRFGRLAAAARLEQLLAQRLELGLVGLEAPQISRRVRANGDRAEHLRWIGQGESRVEVFAQALRIETAAARVAGVVEHGIADLDLGVGEPVIGFGVGCVELIRLGQRVVGRAQSIVVGLGDLAHGRLGAVVQALVVDPQQRLIGHRVIVEKRELLGLARPSLLRELALHRDAERLFLRDELGRPVRLGRDGGQAQPARRDQPQKDWPHYPVPLLRRGSQIAHSMLTD